MITNIWLKSQPNKKISYPDCYPYFSLFMPDIKEIKIVNKDNTSGNGYATYHMDGLSRVEFRP